MIRFITGVPGAGKSYYSVHHIYKIINDPKLQDRYLYIYTNIDRFNYDISPQLCPFNYENLFEKLKRLHKHYKRKKGDEYLIRMARRYKIYKSLFVIDEAHNYFDVRNPVLVWWLSYHRHLYQDIDLITQNLSLIDSKYKGFTEYFIRAVPQSLRLFGKTFKYNLFIDSRMSQKSKAGVEKIKYNPDVFKLYHSGDKPMTKNIVLRFIIISISLLIPVILIFLYVQHKWKSSSSTHTIKTEQKIPQNLHIQKLNDDIKNFDDSVKLILITCINDNCRYEKKSFPIDIIKPIIQLTDSRILHISRSLIQKRSKIYILASESFQNLFKGVDNDQTHSLGIDFFNTHSKSK